jgi:hypothetical protein
VGGGGAFVKPLQLVSCGAGVQSTTLCLMAAHGEITPMPDAAIFADTKGESARVYSHLSWLEKQLPFPVYRVTAGSLEEASLVVRTSAKTGNRYTKSLIPAFVEGHGLLGRRCTADFKVRVIERKARELAGITGKSVKDLRVVQWLGISTDEMQRMKNSIDPWLQFRHPLIEDVRMSRQDCLEWMLSKGYPEPPRSSCVYCPFHSDMEWTRLKEEEPEEFERAAIFEEKLQAAVDQCTGTARPRGRPFLHRSWQPLREVIFKPGDARQQMDMFAEDCAGLCGV